MQKKQQHLHTDVKRTTKIKWMKEKQSKVFTAEKETSHVSEAQACDVSNCSVWTDSN